MKILIVDDNPISQEAVELCMTYWGFDYDVADNGKEAIEKVKDNVYDLCLMDIDMPVMNGIEATRKIRQIIPSSSLPIMAVTARSFREAGQECINAGMNDYVEKPYEFDTLYEKIMKLTTKNKKWRTKLNEVICKY